MKKSVRRIVWLVSIAVLVFSIGGAIFAEEAEVEKPNLALNAKVKVDSSFPSYEGKAITDGVYPDDGTLEWDGSWASADEPRVHWAEITLAEEYAISSVEIFWDWDHGHFMSATQYTVQYWQESEWIDAVTVTEGKAEESTLHEVEFTTNKIRIVMPKKGGSPQRPNILWINQVVVR